MSKYVIPILGLVVVMIIIAIIIFREYPRSGHDRREYRAGTAEYRGSRITPRSVGEYSEEITPTTMSAKFIRTYPTY